MKWFKFDIPLNSDGTRVSYSPGWFGTMQDCPQPVTVVLYNDKEGWGIASTPDTKTLPKECEVIDKAAHDKLLADAVTEDGVFFGKELEDRISWLPKAEVKEEVVGDTVEEIPNQPTVTQKAQFCPTCHVFISLLPSNLIAKQIVMTCKNGHRVVIQQEVK